MNLQKDFHKYNLIIGWGIFFIALLTYGLSVEPTVSFWDCGEYIAPRLSWKWDTLLEHLFSRWWGLSLPLSHLRLRRLPFL